MDIGRRIISCREKRGWTQRELAKRVDLNVSVLNRIELGERPAKDHEVLKISEVLNVTSDYLLGKTSHPSFTVDMTRNEKLKKLEEILDEMPKDKRENMEEMILAYAKGLADANKD